MHRLRIIVIGALAAVALLAGCGGDDSESDSGSTEADSEATTSAISDQDFISTADARCSEANNAVAALSPEGQVDGLAQTADQEGEITKGLMSGLQSIGSPDDPDGSLERYYDALQDEVRALKQQSDAASSGDTASYDALEGELAQAKADARIAAEEFGFEDCGQEGEIVSDGSTDPGEGGDTTGVAPETTAPSTEVPVPTTPAPAPAPAPEPVPEAPPSGGTGVNPGGGGSDSGSSGGISP